MERRTSSSAAAAAESRLRSTRTRSTVFTPRSGSWRSPTILCHESSSPGLGSEAHDDRAQPPLVVGWDALPVAVAPRSSFYYEPQGETEMNLALMLLIDKQFLDTPSTAFIR